MSIQANSPLLRLPVRMAAPSCCGVARPRHFPAGFFPPERGFLSFHLAQSRSASFPTHRAAGAGDSASRVATAAAAS